VEVSLRFGFEDGVSSVLEVLDGFAYNEIYISENL
jgi:hypothetical protein